MKHLLLFFIITLSLGLTACSDEKSPFSREHNKSFTEPGLIIAGVNPQELEDFLVKRSLSARPLGKNSQIFEIDRTEKAHIKSRWPHAVVVENFVFSLADPLVQDHAPIELEVELSPAEAENLFFSQVESAGLKKNNRGRKGQGVVVAVIDSGINIHRPELKNRIWVNPHESASNLIDDDKNGYIDDSHGWNFADNNNELLDDNIHGTPSASVIASELTGVAPLAQILPLKVTRNKGLANMAAIIEAIAYAIDRKAHIINFSMGALIVPPELLHALQELSKKKTLFVAAAGNFSASCEVVQSNVQYQYFDNVITVAALKLSKASAYEEPFSLASYSNYGECVHLAAPAGEGAIAQDYFKRGLVTSHPFKDNFYYLYHGTSAAAPFVSGLAALALSQQPHLSGQELKELLLNSATRTEYLKNKVQDGRVVNGRVAESLLKGQQEPGQ